MSVVFRAGCLAACFFAATTAAGCQTGRAGPSADATAKFVRDSIKWVRDSVVIDSISRTINTDSLYHLYRAQLRAENPVPLEAAINCERTRIHWVYGSNAAKDAIDRMIDTVYGKSDEAAGRRVSARLGSMTPAEMISVAPGQRVCGKTSQWGRMHPDSVNGTRLSGRTGRPTRPTSPE
jgi:hypothetical protein